MTDNDTVQVERLLRETFESTVATAPGQAGAWHRFQTRRRRRTRIVRGGAGLAFAAIVGAGVLASTVVDSDGSGLVAPLAEPVTSAPVADPEAGSTPVGPVLEVASGTTAGRHWVMQLYHNAEGWVCTRWAAGGAGECRGGGGATLKYGINAVADHDGTPEGNKPFGTLIEGTLPREAVRIVIQVRGRDDLELPAKGGAGFEVTAYGTILPGHAIVERMTAYDAGGKVLFDEKEPSNTPWP